MRNLEEDFARIVEHGADRPGRYCHRIHRSASGPRGV